jgi:hypothetical protein
MDTVDSHPKRKIMNTYFYRTYDKKNNEIEPHQQEIEAKDLGHALQKIAAMLSDHAVEVTVWRSPHANR